MSIQSEKNITFDVIYLLPYFWTFILRDGSGTSDAEEENSEPQLFRGDFTKLFNLTAHDCQQ